MPVFYFLFVNLMNYAAEPEPGAGIIGYIMSLLADGQDLVWHLPDRAFRRS